MVLSIYYSWLPRYLRLYSLIWNTLEHTTVKTEFQFYFLKLFCISLPVKSIIVYRLWPKLHFTWICPQEAWSSFHLGVLEGKMRELCDRLPHRALLCQWPRLESAREPDVSCMEIFLQIPLSLRCLCDHLHKILLIPTPSQTLPFPLILHGRLL